MFSSYSKNKSIQIRIELLNLNLQELVIKFLHQYETIKMHKRERVHIECRLSSRKILKLPLVISATYIFTFGKIAKQAHSIQRTCRFAKISQSIGNSFKITFSGFNLNSNYLAPVYLVAKLQGPAIMISLQILIIVSTAKINAIRTLVCRQRVSNPFSLPLHK